MSRPLAPRAVAPSLPSWVWKTLTDDDTLTDIERSEVYVAPRDTLAVAWSKWSAEILRQWARLHPGTRPRSWWKYSSPGPRQRIGGVGTASHERLRAIIPVYFLGVPTGWLMQKDLAVHRKIGYPLNVPAVDFKNPPTFESQATFLDRHGLLLPEERRRLRPRHFRVEKITDIFDFEPP